MTTQDQNGHTSDKDKKSDQQGEKVTLDAETYGQLLDRLDELEGQVATGSKAPNKDIDTGDDIDDLYREGVKQQGSEKVDQQLDLDRLSPTELTHYIESELMDNVVKPVMIKLAQMELNMEINSLEREGIEDFEEHREDVMKVLHNNPRLSLKKAYTLVKAEKTVTKKANETETEENQEPRKDRLRHLPPRPKVHGEKPGTTSTSVDNSMPTTVRGSAKQAIKDLNVKFPQVDEDD